MARTSSAGDHGAQQLEKLRQVFETSVFDTSGGNSDVLKLLLTCCRTLVGHVAEQRSKVERIDCEHAFVGVVESRMAEASAATRSMTEAVKRVDFLWASQGLGEMSLAKGIQQHTELHKPSSYTPGKATTSSIFLDNSGVTDSVIRDQEAADLLRQAQANKATAEAQIRSFGAQDEKSSVIDRLATVEKVVETIHRNVSKVQTDLIRASERINECVRENRALEERFSVLHQATKVAETNQAKEQSKLQYEIERLDTRLKAAQLDINEGKRVSTTIQAATEKFEGQFKELASSKLGGKDVELLVKPIIAKSVNAVDNRLLDLYRMVDVTPEEADAVCGPAVSGGLGADGGSFEQAGAVELSKARLSVIHGGLPFRTVLSSVKMLNASVQQLERRVDLVSGAMKVPNTSRPLLGLELADGAEGIVVIHVFDGLPAHNCGLREDDVILAAGGRKLTDRESFTKAMVEAVGGGASAIPLHVLRAGRVSEMALVLS